MMVEWMHQIDENWTLFLDRDGVINQKLENDYVKHIDDFAFLPEVHKALAICSNAFGPIVVVTNQQGVGKGLMTENELLGIHQFMLAEVFTNGGRIDAIYHCSGLAEDDPPCRKPNTGMAFEARERFPEIDFRKSVMVGDSVSDMEFGHRLGMKCVRIGHSDPVHPSFPSLFHFVARISSK
ncbi:MAG: HAD-IIIA family hydrolase [Cryomorphaceae bacterium]